MALQWNIQKNMTECCQFREECPVVIHIGRIQPDHSILFQKCQDTHTTFPLTASNDIGVDFSLLQLFTRQLRITVESMDLFHLISEESEPVGMFQGIGKYIDDSTPDGILSRCRYKIDTFETLLDQRITQRIVGYLIPDFH